MSSLSVFYKHIKTYFFLLFLVCQKRISGICQKMTAGIQTVINNVLVYNLSKEKKVQHISRE